MSDERGAGTIVNLLSTLQTGGAEAATVASAARLRATGYGAVVVTMRDDRDGLPARRAAALGVPRRNLGARRLVSPVAVVRFARSLRADGVRVVHAQDRDGAIFGAAACALAGVPLVVTRHVLDEPPSNGRERMKRALLSRALRRAETVVAVSGAVRDRVIADDGVQPARVRVVVNGVDSSGVEVLDAATARARLGWPQVPTVGMIGVMRPGKGHAAAIEVARLVRERVDARFVFAGDGELRAALERTADGVVDVLGHRDDVPLVMSACDVVILPSDAEALPTVLIEAAAAGRAVVAFDVGGVPEIVVDDETGMVTPAGDVTTMADAVFRLLADSGARARMGAAARERAVRVFDPAAHTRALVELYRPYTRVHVLFTNSHPSDRLCDERAGHIVRANALIAGLRRAGHDVTVVEAASGSGAQAAAAAYHGRAGRLPPRVRLVARDTVRAVQSVLHGLRVAGAARRSHADVIVETHNTSSVAGALGALLSRRPLVLDDVTPAFEDDRYYELGVRWWARLARRAAVRRSARLVTVSDGIREALRAEGVDATRVSLVPNGVAAAATPAQGIAWRLDHGVAPDRTVVVYVGSFQQFHRVDLLVRAVADPAFPPQVDVVLAGDGETRADAEALAAELGVSGRLWFVGRVPSVSVPVVLAAADLAVLPATEEYMNPMKLYEYLGAGLVAVAPDQQAVAGVVSEVGTSARVVTFAPGDASALASALARAVAVVDQRGSAAEPACAATWDERALAFSGVLVAAVAER
jgi:glycosyltransferase involved in cell wall biosynthesis